jgi:hypothetical protein
MVDLILADSVDSIDGALIGPGQTQYHLRSQVAVELIQQVVNPADSRPVPFLPSLHPSPNVVLGYAQVPGNDGCAFDYSLRVARKQVIPDFNAFSDVI